MNPAVMSDRQLALAALGPVQEADRVAARLASPVRAGETPLGSPRRSPRFGGRVRLTALAAMLVAVAGNLTAIRLVPTYAQAVSNAPFVSGLPRQMLDLAGLSEAQVSRVAVSATSSGHTVTLLAASADSARTVLLIQVDGRDSIPSKTAAGYLVDGYLTDQYGQTYQGGGYGGNLWFAPLRGRAASGPVEVTLHLDFMRLWPAQVVGVRSGVDPIVKGDWVVKTTVTRRAGVAVPLPAPKTIGMATYTVTSIRISGTEVTIDWKVTGDPRIAVLWNSAKNSKSQPARDPLFDDARNAFISSILNPDGSIPPSVKGNADSFGFSQSSDHLIEGTAQQVLTAHGDYVLRIGPSSAVEFPFKVP